MSRYIDADVLRKTIEFCHYFGDDGITFNASEKEVLMQLIDDAPTIDVVEVVRCKDCKWIDFCKTENARRQTRNEKWYCADGERKSREF